MFKFLIFTFCFSELIDSDKREDDSLKVFSIENTGECNACLKIKEKDHYLAVDEADGSATLAILNYYDSIKCKYSYMKPVMA